jgi:hypothetical protein
MRMLAADVPPAYVFTAAPLSVVLRHRLYGSSWRPGCPVGLDDLRYLRVGYYGFDGRAHRGELVVNKSATTRRPSTAAARRDRRAGPSTPTAARSTSTRSRNPYVYADGTTTHAASRPYLDRSEHRKGMGYPGGALVKAFKKAGWGWGGDWPLPTDHQHFSANGT